MNLSQLQPARAASLSLALLAVPLASCARSSMGTGGSALGAHPSSLAWADSVLGTLSLRDQAAQLVWPWILGDFVAERSAEWERVVRFVRDEHVGGFIISVGSPLDIAAKANALQRESALPLLMSADVETGVGFRARGGFFLPNGIDLGGATTFPLQMGFGAAADTNLAYEAGRVTALEARALGIQIGFGPVLDVNNNPDNPVIGARSYSEDPQLAGRLGASYTRGLQEHGVLATGKHFPGHGDTETNSHLALSVVNASRARLDSVELVPFRDAIRAGVGAIMTFHGFLPALDSSGVPATLSPLVMTELLRNNLKFTGLLVTDAMDMKGVVDRYGAAEANKRAIAAGNDVLLMPAEIGPAIDAIVAGVAEGRYGASRVRDAARRVLQLKAGYGLQRNRFVSLDSVRMVVGDSSHVALANRIAQRGIVLAKDSLKSVPIAVNARQSPTLVVTFARRSDLGAGLQFGAELRRSMSNVRQVYVNADEASTNWFTLQLAADSAALVVVASYVNISSESATAAAPGSLADFVTSLVARHRNVVVVTFGTPYLLRQMPSVPAYLIAWGGSPASQLAAARALLGDAVIDARLPTSIPPLLRIGSGEKRDVLPRNTTRPSRN